MKLVAKGKIQSDNSYTYTCGNCEGVGFLLDSRRGDELCSHCYNGDYVAITEALKQARGQRYYALLKSALKVAGKPIADKAMAMKAEHGKVTVAMLGYMAVYFNLNFKAFGEWLEECRIMPSGMTEEIQSRLKVKEILAGGVKWYQETYGKNIEIWSKE